MPPDPPSVLAPLALDPIYGSWSEVLHLCRSVRGFKFMITYTIIYLGVHIILQNVICT